MGWGTPTKPRFQSINVTCTNLVLLHTISRALGLWWQGTLAAEPGSLSWRWVGILGGGGRIKLPQGEPGNCFGAKSKVRGIKSKMACGSQSAALCWWGALGEEEEKGKKVKLNRRKHSWLARRRKFLFACAVGLPLTWVFLRAHLFLIGLYFKNVSIMNKWSPCQ